MACGTVRLRRCSFRGPSIRPAAISRILPLVRPIGPEACPLVITTCLSRRNRFSVSRCRTRGGIASNDARELVLEQHLLAKARLQLWHEAARSARDPYPDVFFEKRVLE
jgi:hypothetical protein